MARHVHVHVHDDGFNESDHPRASNGKFGSGGGSAGGGGKGKAGAGGSSSKPKAPTAPDLKGPKAQEAIAKIKAAGAKGDWRAVANVNVLGTHPLVATYRKEMEEHVQAGSKALTEAVGKKKE